MRSPPATLAAVGAMIACSLMINTPVLADVFAYHGPNGERLLTDKRISDKQYRLVKTYKTLSKPKATRSSSSRSSKRKNTGSSSTLTYQCGNQNFINRQKDTYKNIVRVYAAKYGVEEALIYSVVKQESCFNEKALSHAGAMGLMQLMPATASHLKVKDPWNPEQNIQGGVKYLSWMLKRFKGNKKHALAAYNAGPGKVERYGGIPPYRETQHYVKKIMADYNRQKRLDQKTVSWN